MSDGSPVLGPKTARPGLGAPRNSPGFDASGDTGFLSDGPPIINVGAGGYRMTGVVVKPWLLVRNSAVRSINVGGGQTISMEIDAAWFEVR